MTHCDCVSVALVVQHAMRMRHIVICVLSLLTIFSTLSHKRHDFQQKPIEHKMRFDVLCKVFFLKCFSF